MKKSLTILLFFIFLNSQLPILNSAEAYTMSNDDFIIDMGNMNSGSGNASNGKTNVQSAIGQAAPGLYTGKNYSVKSGFEYNNPLSAFAFELTETAIDFGALTATTPVTRTTNIKVVNNGAA